METEITFTIKCKMKEEWKDAFISFLKEMEYNGKVGHSDILGFFSDGDGSFQPKFEVDVNYNLVEGKSLRKMEDIKNRSIPEKLFDIE